MEDRVRKVPGNVVSSVTALELSANEIIIGCIDPVKSGNCSNSNRKVFVTTAPGDPENDILTCEYTISGGKIIGQGAKIIWDLSGVKPGTYTITAGVNNGCGICGSTMTKTVVVKECADCSK